VERSLLPSDRVIFYSLTIYNRYCAGGELFKYIIDHKHLSEPEAAIIMSQLFGALKYLHDMNISHR
jgi:calcium-dependent protein kinase